MTVVLPQFEKMKAKQSYEEATCQQVFPLFQKYRDELLQFVNRRLRDQEQSEALVSDVLMKMHRHCEQITHIKNVRAWLFQVTRNTVNDYFREQARSRNEPLLTHESPLSMASEKSDSLAGLIPSLLDCLPGKYAQPLRMSDLEGIPQKAIAQELNLSLSAVKSRIQRGRIKLKGLFEECLHLELDRQGMPTDFSVKATCLSLSTTNTSNPDSCTCD